MTPLGSGNLMNSADGGDILDDKIHNRLLIRRGERIMTFAFLDDELDPSGQFLVSLLGDPRLGFEPPIEAAAEVEESRAGQAHQCGKSDEP